MGLSSGPRALVASARRLLSGLDAESAALRADDASEYRRQIGRSQQILVVAAVLLALGYSFGDKPYFDSVLGPPLVARFPSLERHLELISYTYWSAAKLLGFGILPALHLALLGERLGDYGLRAEARAATGGARLSWPKIYLLLFAAIAPFVLWFSRSSLFVAAYPFYRQTGRSYFDLVAWELQYLSTFVAVEFFFRGYLLFGLRRALGSLSLFVAMLPYCLIHVLKPPVEALGSIGAGLLLGALAVRTGSLWCGVALHVSVALLMDLLAAGFGGRWPVRLLP